VRWAAPSGRGGRYALVVVGSRLSHFLDPRQPNPPALIARNGFLMNASDPRAGAFLTDVLVTLSNTVLSPGPWPTEDLFGSYP